MKIRFGYQPFKHGWMWGFRLLSPETEKKHWGLMLGPLIIWEKK